MTEITVNKLEQAFAFGCTDIEACLFADISRPLLYSYEKKHPGFLDRKAMLKENPVLLARQSVVNDLGHNSDLSLKYLERKKKDEFSLRSEVSHTLSVEDVVRELEDDGKSD